MRGFRNFLMRGNLIDLAVAVVIGVAFNDVVHGLVNDLVTPLISAAGGSRKTFASLSWRIGHSEFLYGAFLNSVLSFMIIAAVVYYVLVAPATRLTAFANRNKAATQRECPECLSQIPVGAKRCMYCTAEVTPIEVQAAEVPQQRPHLGRHHAPTEQ